MDIKELNKKQLILLTLLITFVVSIATGIITVSLMQQAPKAVTQTVNNVIQRTIEKVTTVPATDTNTSKGSTKDQSVVFGEGDAIISIYPKAEPPVDPGPGAVPPKEEPKAIGQGIIISDVGLVLIDSTILNGDDKYRVILNKVDFDATVIKKFPNGFAVLKISQKSPEKADDKKDANNQGASALTPVDNAN
jgi:hypothetical protein